MTHGTQDAIRAILSADASIPGILRARMLEALKNAETAQVKKVVDPVVRRLEAAERLSVSPRTLDLWRRQGRIRAVSFGRGTRAVGFRESDLIAFTEGGAA